MIPTPRLQLWHAPLHPTLRDACIAALDAAALDAEPCILWVPTHALGADLVRAHARRYGATFAVHPVTSVELARALTRPERGPAGRRRVGPEARAWLLRQLDARRDRGRTCFDAALAGRGFRAALGRSFEALSRGGLAASPEIERCLVRHGLDMPLPARHLLELYLAYRRSFEVTHDDTAALLAQAARVPAGRCAATLGRRLFVFGFTAMDGLERRLLAHLGRDAANSITVCVPAVEPEEPGWCAALEAAGFVAAPVPASQHSVAAPERAAAVEVIAAPSAESEADEIARAVLAAAGAGTSFADMAVIARHPARLELLHAALVRRGIPVSLHPGRSLGATRSGRALLAFFDLLLTDLEPEAVFAFLSTAPLRAEWTGVESDPVPSAWERAGRDAFLGRGLEDWTGKLERLAAELLQQAEQRELQHEPALQARAAAQAAGELLLLARSLAAALASFPKRAGWGDYIAATDAFLVAALTGGDELEALRQALERLRALAGLGTASVSRPEFRDAVRGLLAEAVLPAPAGDAAVQLGTAAALQGLEFALVCLAGVQEGEWPAAPAEDPVLLPNERDAVAACLEDPTALDAASRGLRRDRRAFALWCGAAREKLLLSWARFDATTGAACLPSALLLEYASRREGRDLDYAGLEALPWVERVPLHRQSLPESAPVLGLDELDTMHLLQLPSALGRRYVLGLGECARRGLGLDRLRNHAGRFTSVDGALAGRAVHYLQQRFAAPTFSPTQLATYATCPFRFFLRQVLRLEPLDRDDRREVSALRFGRLVHRVLELFYRELAAADVAIGSLSDADLAARLQQAQSTVLDEVESRGQTGAQLLWEIRKQRLGEDLRQFLRAERARAGAGWRPQSFEWRFGPGTECVPGFGPAGVGRVRLRGIIDRVDRAAGHDGVRIVDYKSGRTLPAARAPQAAQLAVYLYAATGGVPETLAHSEALFAYVTRRGGFAVQRLTGATLRQRAGDLEGLVLEVAAGVRRGDFFPRPGPDREHCKSCDFEAVCDARVAQQAAFKAAAGQAAFVDLLPDFATALEGEAIAGDAPAGDAAEDE